MIYFIPVWIFQENNILEGTRGHSVGVHGLSLVSFTCMFTVVTGRLIIWTRWWTYVNFFFYSIMSIFVYILYIWVSEIFGLSLDIRHAVEPLHASPLFWLTLLLVGGGCFLFDVLVEYLRITYIPNGSDFVRILMKDKKGDGWNDL